MKKAGYSKEIMKKNRRLFKEAYEQGVLLTHSEMAYLLNVSTGAQCFYRYCEQAKEYMQRTGEILPTRGIIQDIGRAITHKRIILRLYRKGIKLQIL